jgi:HPt (histidine-containing phosphotransfer) domain-containing protein
MSNREHSTAPVDLERMREAADGDEDFLRQLVEVFIDDTDLRVRELSAAISAGDPRVVGRTAHQLKGSSANMGANGLFDFARRLEKLGEGNSLSGASELFTALEAEFHRVRSELKRVIAES